jgi:molecular chaperone DnaK
MTTFGIDFGTTNSGAVELQNSTFRNYGNDGKPLPSVVAIDMATGKAKVGAEVKGRFLEYRNDGNFHVIRSVKAFLGSDRHWPTQRGAWTPVMVAAEILRKLSAEVVRYGTEEGIRAATFSVPVGITLAATRALRKAAALAGIKVNGIVKESTAALFRYVHRICHCRYVVVFDWGGGTLDVSVLELRGHTIYERYTKGMPRAGDEIDDAIARKVHAYFCDGAVAFEAIRERERDALLTECERAKCKLSDDNEAYIQLPEYAGKPLISPIDRDFCRPVIEPIVRDAIELLAAAISRAKLSCDAIDEIVIIGGSSRLWLLREMLEADERFAGRSFFAGNPEWDVARGAAVIDQHPGSYALAEIIGLELSDGSYFEMARPGDHPGDQMRSVSLALIEDVPAANVVIDRWEGDPDTCRELAVQFTVPALGFDQEAVELSWRLTEDLTLSVEGKNQARGKESFTEREITPLRFGYRIEGGAQE